MKKVLLTVFTFLFIFLFITPSYADSPITSTDFSRAYDDIEIVQKAYQGTVTTEIAGYLSSPDNPIDVKAAVINALSFDVDGKDNAERFSQLVFNKSVDELDINSLKPEDVFCIGYLKAMDDYFNPDKALPYLELAKSQMKDSFTVAIVTSIVDAQTYFETDWNYMWKVVENVINDKKLKNDMRTEGIEIIVDYMMCYSDIPVINQFAEKNIIRIYTNKPDVIINNADFEDGYNQGSILQIKNNKVFMKIDPLIKTLGGTTSWDKKQKKMTIKLNGKKIDLWIGKKLAYVNGAKRSIDAPYISKSKNMIPLKFIIESLGYKYQWQKKIKQVEIEVKNINLVKQSPARNTAYPQAV